MTMLEKKFPIELWHGKPYYSLDAYCKNNFQYKYYKIALDAHMTCPNRDGTIDSRGCIFCSSGGSGDFSVKASSMEEQLEKGLELFGNKKIGSHFIAYFQAYSNTYAPIQYLEKIYREALLHPNIYGISIATRPDCITSDIVNLIVSLQKEFKDKFIWIELGLQSMHEKTAIYIRRGYTLSIFEKAFYLLKTNKIPVIIHIILGLPYETKEEILKTIQYVNQVAPFGIKLQLLHILEGTDLAKDYRNHLFSTLTQEEYLTLLIDCLELLSPEIIIHRLTGDGPKHLLIAPTWSMAKRNVLNALHQKMKIQETYQGRLYYATRPTNSI